MEPVPDGDGLLRRAWDADVAGGDGGVSPRVTFKRMLRSALEATIMNGGVLTNTVGEEQVIDPDVPSVEFDVCQGGIGRRRGLERRREHLLALALDANVAAQSQVSSEYRTCLQDRIWAGRAG